MSPTMLRDKWVKSRKAHRCTLCSHTIDPGEDYHYNVTVGDWGDLHTTKLHRFCHDVCERHVFPNMDPDGWYPPDEFWEWLLDFRERNGLDEEGQL